MVVGGQSVRRVSESRICAGRREAEGGSPMAWVASGTLRQARRRFSPGAVPKPSSQTPRQHPKKPNTAAPGLTTADTSHRSQSTTLTNDTRRGTPVEGEEILEGGEKTTESARPSRTVVWRETRWPGRGRGVSTARRSSREGIGGQKEKRVRPFAFSPIPFRWL
jgi:hypothetical protein